MVHKIWKSSISTFGIHVTIEKGDKMKQKDEKNTNKQPENPNKPTHPLTYPDSHKVQLGNIL